MDPLVWGLGLLGVALGLLILEIFVPSGGVIGIVALVVAIAGLVGLYRTDTLWGVAGTLAVIVSVPMALWTWVKVFPNTPIGRAMMGGDDSPGDGSFGDGPGAHAPDGSREALGTGGLPPVGSTGQALTDLHPSGFVEIDGKRYDALAQATLVDAGEAIVVTGRSGAQVEVDRA